MAKPFRIRKARIFALKIKSFTCVVVAAAVIEALADLESEYPEVGEDKLKELATAKKKLLSNWRTVNIAAGGQICGSRVRSKSDTRIEVPSGQPIGIRTSKPRELFRK